MAVGFDAAQHLAGPQDHRRGHPGKAGGLDAVAAAGSPRHHPVQKHQGLAGFFDQDLGVGDVGQQRRQLVELVIVGRKDAAGSQIAGQVLGHGPGDRQSVKGGGAAPDLIKQHH